MSQVTARKTRKVEASDSSNPVDVSEFDEWAETRRGHAGCAACSNAAVSDTINALLQAMIRKCAYKITIGEIHNMLIKKHPDITVGRRCLERHLQICVRPTYDKARGR